MYRFKKVKLFVITNKKISVAILIVLLLITYFAYKKLTSTTGEVRYVVAKVEKKGLTASVSGTGQISSIDQNDIKSKISGDIVYIGASNGQKINAGVLLAEIDAKEARKTVRDAEISLESSQLALEKLKIQNSNESQNTNLVKVYNNGFTTVSSVFSDLTTITDNLNNILGESNLSENSARTSGNTAVTYREKAEDSYYVVDRAFFLNKKHYYLLNNNSPEEDIKNIILETYETTKLLSNALKNFSNFIDYMANDSNNSSAFSTNQALLATYTNTINTALASLFDAGVNIKTSSLDIKNAELTVKQKENALQDAKDNLSDYYIRAPISGTVANLNLKKSDSVSTGTLVASITTNKQNASISLNEVDVAKIKIGKNATLTFDAVPDLTISGLVTEINPIGSVDQGVVTYDIKINFDTQDERVKSGMSVSAIIVTDTKQDILTVPNSAVKSLPTQMGQEIQNYVEMFDSPLVPSIDKLPGSISKINPKRVMVEVGISNDTHTEILSGLKEGDEIVIRTITSKTTAPTAPSIFGASTGGNRTGATKAN